LSLYYIQDKNCHQTEICFIIDEAVEAEITRVESDPHEEREHIYGSAHELPHEKRVV